MKRRLLLSISVFLTAGFLSAQTIWTGPTMTFTKAAFADHTQPANQDAITADVRITRANTMGIFNIATEPSFVGGTSPAGTEWAFGTTAIISTLTFANWETTIEVNGMPNPPASVNQDMVLHLIADDIFIDIRFTAWGQGGNGGGSFTYERSTPGAVSVSELTETSLSLAPNPSATGDIQVTLSGDFVGSVDVQVLDLTGQVVREWSGVSFATGTSWNMDLSEQTNGVYFVQMRNEAYTLTERVVLRK